MVLRIERKEGNMKAVLPEEIGPQLPRDPNVDPIKFSQGVREGQIFIRRNDYGEPCEIVFTVNDADAQFQLDREGRWVNAELKRGKDLGAILIPKARRGDDPRMLDLFAILARMILARFPPKGK
jgi:hypothetical protein